MKAVEQVTSACQTCVYYKRPSPRPVVSLPLANSFNETVAVDLKSWKQVYFLVMVDLATRYCSSVVITNKMTGTVVKALFQAWITTFGAPRQFLMDNGGEFNNDAMRCLGDKYGIKLICTAAESPWSNGVCERLNCVLGINVQRVIDDTNYTVTIGLVWAVAAGNSLQNSHGFSPNQLVFGANPILPNVWRNMPPALEGRPDSHVKDNLNAMHSARKKFVKLESEEKIRRTLLHQVRGDTLEELENDDDVFYKRNNDDR